MLGIHIYGGAVARLAAVCPRYFCAVPPSSLPQRRLPAQSHAPLCQGAHFACFLRGLAPPIGSHFSGDPLPLCRALSHLSPPAQPRSLALDTPPLLSTSSQSRPPASTLASHQPSAQPSHMLVLTTSLELLSLRSRNDLIAKWQGLSSAAAHLTFLWH